MKKILKGGLVSLFILLLLLGTLMIHTILQAQSYGKLINYVGIVRGGTQRLVKLEMNGWKSDHLVVYLDGILEELNGKAGPYDLLLPRDQDYQDNLVRLNEMWGDLKDSIYQYRSGQIEEERLLLLSEDYFEQANNTVFAADNYAAGRFRTLLILCIVMLGIMLATWIFIFWAASKKMLLLEKTNKALNELTRRDPLTGAYQAEDFKREAQRLLDMYPGNQYAVVYTDFSDFKYMNDVFGYTYGDRILKEYGCVLLKGLQDQEICGRIFADQFVLLLRYNRREEIVRRQRQADDTITEFMLESDGRQSISSCCGICCVEDVLEDLKIEGLLDRANFARKTVKNGSNPNYVFYNDSIRKGLWEEKGIESKMADALKNHEFVVYYQPKVNPESGRAAGAEALVRWRMKDGTVIPPDKFIPVFEQKFMIGQLDRYVYEEVCRLQRQLMEEGLEAVPVSVNVSRLQFYDQDFISKYVEIRKKYDVPADLLEVEFTESIVFDNEELLLKTVQELKQAGFSCAIDDFGKGYSSLSLLKTLSVDVLKIDSFFFDNGDDEERDMEVVHGIIDLVHKFQIRTVAEGIENMKQVEYLKQMGCDYIQGYVFYRPMPEDEYAELLRKEQMQKEGSGYADRDKCEL